MTGISLMLVARKIQGATRTFAIIATSDLPSRAKDGWAEYTGDWASVPREWREKVEQIEVANHSSIRRPGSFGDKKVMLGTRSSGQAKSIEDMGKELVAALVKLGWTPPEE